MINVVVSFDYELFLGENYKDSNEILFKPTNKLLELLGSYQVTSTFFADVCSVLAHQKSELFEFADGFSYQLREIIDKGHDVQLHIHPNWLLSDYFDEKWHLNTSHYMIHKFGFDERKSTNAYKIIDDCINYLETIIKPINPDYKCVAYRAGGYSIQPHDKLFRYLRNKGIMIDSSVCSGQYCFSDTLNYDFRNMPLKTNWWITPDKSFEYCGEKKSGGLFEIPLLSDKNSIIKKILIKEYSDRVKTEPLNGTYIKMNTEMTEKNPTICEKVMNYTKGYALVSFDSMPAYRMIDFFNRFEKRHHRENVFVSVICHPKLVDSGVLNNMEQVLKALTRDDRFCFTNMAKIADDCLNFL